MAKNEFKKSYADKKVDENGKKLPEVIGKGLNKDHLIAIENAKGVGSYIRFRISAFEKLKYKNACEDIEGMNESEISRALHNAFTNGKIEIK